VSLEEMLSIKLRVILNPPFATITTPSYTQGTTMSQSVRCLLEDVALVRMNVSFSASDTEQP